MTDSSEGSAYPPVFQGLGCGDTPSTHITHTCLPDGRLSPTGDVSVQPVSNEVDRAATVLAADMPLVAGQPVARELRDDYRSYRVWAQGQPTRRVAGYRPALGLTICNFIFGLPASLRVATYLPSPAGVWAPMFLDGVGVSGVRLPA